MTAKGYILLQEVIAVCLLCLVCAAAVLSFSCCLRLEQKNLALQRCLQSAEACLAGEEISEGSVSKSITGMQVQFLEVEVSDGENKLTLVEVLTSEEAERLSALGTAF